MRKFLPGARWLLTAMALCGFASAAMAAEPVAGQDYEVLDNPVPTELPEGQIGVTEVFWYGCPHCYEFEEPLEAWVAEQPDDVTFDRLPATMGDTWMRHAAAFYAAKDLGIFSEQFHRDFFNAIHQEGQRLIDPDDIAEFFTHYGVDRQAALDALDSFGVRSQLNQATARMKAYQLMGVPALVVDGRYVITPRSAGGLANMLKVADSLIEQVREQQANAG
ncbi:thiol:disulfide interchange protein DsbA/DsbL [Kushneria aurantia]|uniref:Thiol:disulfide interchange protein n=1 Tax=Kushneria aurantia TaxID=504092 RepID=A0ABV6G202_9GAMM|nr:thiol:disulfide interchange protein DsbA/DsbL [Kushneria aurantia]